jgi:DNA excision repair protein ERCC-4
VLLDAENRFWEKVDSRIAGGQVLKRTVKKVLVDVREFRCSLPMALFNRRMDVIPVTLEIGDYILSNDIAVERKSPSDLSQSLRSGRLYKQCQALSSHYEIPVLLIEFSQSNAFRLSFSSSDSELDVPQRLALLAIHFPKVRFIWSAHANATAEIFEDLQMNQVNPDLERAQHIGSSSDQQIDGDCDPVAAVFYFYLRRCF